MHVRGRSWPRDPRLLPLVAAPLLCAVGVLEAWTDTGFRPHFATLVVVACWLAAALLLQGRYPAAGAVAVAGFAPLTAALGAPGPGGAGLIAMLLAAAYCGFASPRRRSLLAVGLAVAVFVVTDLAVRGLGWDTVFFPLVFLPARWAGWLVRREQERGVELLALTAALEAERELSAAAAAQEERTRIARDVHDSVAHSVSVMTLQIGGLRRQLDGVLAGRPAERDVLLGLERIGRDTVEELRALVGILRDPRPEDGPLAPTPSLSRAADVVEEVRAAGLDVRLRVEGTPRELPRALDISAYRILQEALTNVLRHAPGSTAEVVLGYDTTVVELRVRDDGRGAGPAPTVNGHPHGGHGIVGMTERAHLVGGTLTAGPRPGDRRGFEVHARLPTGRVGG